uniref:Uncharacterized protein n=1 Tax=Cacopsylla melanoneura TaxID=428564 RepID=A0A8D8TU55_9HEMI
MATNLLNKKMESSLYITKTLGDKRIKEAKDNNEDCAILTTFLPPGFEPETKNMFFECALKHRCFLGNSKLKTPGKNLILFDHALGSIYGKGLRFLRTDFKSISRLFFVLFKILFN